VGDGPGETDIHDKITNDIKRFTGKISEVSIFISRCIISTFLLNLREIGWDGMDWIDLAQDRDQWRALVNTVMNLRFS
jgi:hypothetical protein